MSRENQENGYSEAAHMKLHLVTMENPISDFRYVLGVFNTARKAEVAAQYELQRRRAVGMPKGLTPRITKVDVDRIYSDLNVDALEKMIENRA